MDSIVMLNNNNFFKPWCFFGIYYSPIKHILDRSVGRFGIKHNCSIKNFKFIYRVKIRSKLFFNDIVIKW